ncbi:MAG TPA: YtxH domain-containing protein [Anaerolineales bacterium]|nr:YtxH domain-containing protein [Anaerolineales bacterium]
MDDAIEQRTDKFSGPRNILIGLVVGGLAGAAAMLLFAPQSGTRTRAQIRRTGIQLRDRTTASVKEAMAQVRLGADEVKAGVREKAGELKQRGQDKLVEQLDRASAALDAGKKAVKAA